MIFILDKKERVINVLKNNKVATSKKSYFDDLLYEDLDTGASTFSVSTNAYNEVSQDLIVGNYVAFKDKKGNYRLFQITNVETEHNESMTITIYSECAGLSLINNVFRKRKMTSVTIRKFVDAITENTDWSTGFIEEAVNTSLDLDIPDGSCYSTLQTYIKKFGVEIEFRVELNNGRISKKYIDVYRQRGRVTGKRFTYGRDIEKIVKTSDSSELYTALIGRGKNDVTFRDVTVEGIDKPLGQDFVADKSSFERFNRNGYHLTGIYSVDSESPEVVLRETYKKLQEVKEPKVSYEIPVVLLGELLGIEYDKVSIGDQIGILDTDFNPPLMLSARVSKLYVSETNNDNTKCVLSNFKEVSSNITEEMRKIASELEGYVDKKFPIGSSDIQEEAVNGSHMDKQYVTQITADIVKASLIEAEKIVADEISAVNGKFQTIDAEIIKTNEIVAKLGEFDTVIADKVEAVEGNFETISADYGEFKHAYAEKITAIDGNFTNIDARLIETDKIVAGLGEFDKVIAQKVESVEGEFGEIKADVGRIDTLLNGNLTSDNIQAGGITSDKLTISEGFIKNAMIESVNASKINAGEVNTNKVHITSENGGIVIADNTQQFKDKNGKVRIQMGQDAQGNFNFGVFDETGTGTLIDATGVKEKALADGIIKDRMINEGEIGGNKIDISSMIEEVNKDTNVKTIKGSKVQLDTEGQTLDIAFNTLKTNVDNIQVGGRNLIEGTDMTSLWSVYATNRGRVSLTDNGQLLTWISTGQAAIMSPFTQQLENETKYTLTFKARGTLPKLEVYVLSNPTPNVKLKEWNNALSDTEFREFTITVTYNHVNPCTQLFIGGIANLAEQWLEIEKKTVKFESGTKATDWSPAPEDIEEKIESNTTAISVQQGKINTLIQDTTIEKDGQTLKLKDEYSKLEQTVSGINSTVGSHSSSITNLQGGLTTANGNISGLQGQMSSANSNISNLTGKVSTVESKQATFEQNLESITQRVSSTESTTASLSGQITATNDKIDSIEVGGRNLLLGTTSDYKEANLGDFFGTIAAKKPIEEYGLKVGDTITFSLMLNIDKNQPNGAKSRICQYRADGTYNTTLGNLITSGSNGLSYVSTKIKDTTTEIRLAVQKDGAIGTGSPRVTVNYKECKLEKGNKVTGWSPAPEDVNEDISAVDGKVATLSATVETTKNKVAEIVTDIDSITQRVSSTETNVTTLSGKVTTAQNDAKDAKDKIENLQIGGKNFIKNSLLKKDSANWNLTSGIAIIDSSELHNGHKTFKLEKVGVTTNTWGGISQYNVIDNPKQGDVYTLSYWYLVKDKSTFNDGFAIELKGRTISNTDTGIGYTTVTPSMIVEGEWTKISFQVTIYRTDLKYLFLYGWVRQSGQVWFSEIKAEKGNKATDFTEAPEDIDSTIAEVNAEITTTNNKVASIETTVNNITQRVESTESTTATLTTKVGTAQSTADAAKSTADSAKSTANTAKSTADAANTNATNANNKIDNLQVGGSNLYLDTKDFTSSPSVWKNYTGWEKLTTKYKNFTVMKRSNSWVGLYQPIEMKAGELYTLSFYGKVETGGTIVLVPRTSVNDYTGYQGLTILGGNFVSSLSWVTTTTDGTQWNRYYAVVKATTDCTVQLRPENGISGKPFNICGLKLEIGNKPTDWTPAPEDIEADITEVTLQVTNTNKKVSQIETTVNGISSKVTSLESTTTKNTKVGSFRYIRDWLNGNTINTSNHWIELKVMVGDTNIAQGLTATSDITVSNIGNYTDGRVDSNYTSCGAGWHYLQLDLGKIREDVDSLQVWHYYTDGRSYNHRLEVSRDGSTWYTLYDSDKMGKYKETDKGRFYLINESSTETRLKSAESKITSDAIVNTVKSHQTNGKNTFAQTSQVEQTVDSWVAKFTSTGGSNLLKNSDAKNGQYMWNGNGVTLTIGTSGLDPFIGGNEFKSTFPNGLQYSENIKLKSNTEYVYEAWIYCDKSMTGTAIAPLHYWCMTTAGTAGQSQLEVLDYRQNITANKFNKCYIHFRTKSGNVYFTPFVYGGPEGSTVAVRQLSLTEGKVETAWTPHPSEIYEGSTVIDGSGVTVNNGALRVKNKAGQTVLSGDNEGNLSLTGSIVVSSHNHQILRVDTADTKFPHMVIDSYGPYMDQLSVCSDYAGYVAQKAVDGVFIRNNRMEIYGTGEKFWIQGNARIANMVTCNGSFQGKDFSLGETSGDRVLDSPWYGLGRSTNTSGGGRMVQLSGYFGLLFKTAGNTISIPNSGGISITGPDLITINNNNNWKGLDLYRYGCRARYGIGSDGTGGNQNFPAIECWNSGAGSYASRLEVKSDQLQYYSAGGGTLKCWTDTGGHGGISIGNTGSGYLKWLRGHTDLQCRNYADNAYTRINASVFVVNSKKSVKENIEDFKDDEAINILMSNKVRHYNLINERKELEAVEREAEVKGFLLDEEMVTPDNHLGLVIEELTPEALDVLQPGRTEGIDIYAMTSLLWKVCQAQENKIKSLEKENNELKDRLKIIEEKLGI